MNRQGVDVAVFAQVLRQAVQILGEIGEEIIFASENLSEYSLENVQNLLTAFNIMETFSEQALEVWNRRFADIEDDSIGESAETTGERTKSAPEGLSKDATNRVRVANTRVTAARQRLAFSP